MKVTFAEIPISQPDITGTYARAVEQWHDRNDVNVPVEGQNTQRDDMYWRFVATRIATSTKGTYNWTFFDNLFKQAIDARKRLNFGMMTVFPDGSTGDGLVSFDGGTACYPVWLHQEMQQESVKDWRSGSTWVPNYNSPKYLQWLRDLHAAIYTRIQTQTYNNVRYAHVINIIDIRGYGSWGEWHSANLVDNVSQYPAGTFPTEQTFKSIVDAHLQGFPTIQCNCMIAAFDANWLNNTKNPPYIAHYILTHPGNAAGKIGWRRDQWGATDNYLRDYLENNNRNYNGSAPFKTWIMDRWKESPITGEPPAWNPNDYADLERQIRLYRASSFGNGNYGVTPNSTIKERVRSSSKASGYRLRMIDIDFTLTADRSLKLISNWINSGLAPTYHNWDIVFTLTASAGGGKYDIGKSAMVLKKYLPEGVSKTTTENVAIPATVPNGIYKLSFSVRDPNAYMRNLNLAMQNRQSDGSYIIGDITVGGIVVPNQPPTAHAGSDMTIVSPVSSATLHGTASDGDGLIIFGEWSVFKGGGTIVNKNAYVTAVNNIPEGENEYQWLVRDDDGAEGKDTVKVIRQPDTPQPQPCPEKYIKKLAITYNNDVTEIKP